MVSHHPDKFGGHSRGGGDFRWQRRRFQMLSPQSCLSLKDMAWKHTAYHFNNSNPGHTC